MGLMVGVGVGLAGEGETGAEENGVGETSVVEDRMRPRYENNPVAMTTVMTMIISPDIHIIMAGVSTLTANCT